MDLFIPILCLVASLVAAPRWLRIAQREHYLPRSVTRFAIRWWSAGQVNLLLAVAAVTASLSAFSLSVMALATAGIIVAAPVGPDAERAHVAAGVDPPAAHAWRRSFAVLDVALFLLAAATPTSAALASILCFLQPVIVDVALLVTLPFERLAARRWVRQAEQRLRAAAPVTVAITGSYGKTTTKLYVRHLVAGQRTVLASPASFNNTGGLARTLNEHLAPGTEVFVAEMGTYGPGEIRAMCEWVRPTIGVIVNIGPVHLERMQSLDGVVAGQGRDHRGRADGGAQRERPRSGRRWPTRLAARGHAGGAGGHRAPTRPAPTWSCSTTATATSTSAPAGHAAPHRGHAPPIPANVASALGVVVALGLDVAAALPRLDTLPVAEHRQEISRSAKGVVVIDNTFSSNPASAASSLALVRPAGRARAPASVVVTPGMVELGPAAARGEPGVRRRRRRRRHRPRRSSARPTARRCWPAPPTATSAST